MDKETQRVLMEIGMSIPRHLLKKAIKTERPFLVERQLAEEVMKNPKTPRKEREMLRRWLSDSVKLYESQMREVTETDPDIAREIDLYVATKVKKAIRTGKIKPPDKDDSFFSFLNAHSKK